MQRNKVSGVFTLARVATELGESEDALFDLIGAMEPEDGLIWVYGPGDEQCPAFTGEGIDDLKERIASDKADSDPLPPKP